MAASWSLFPRAESPSESATASGGAANAVGAWGHGNVGALEGWMAAAPIAAGARGFSRIATVAPPQPSKRETAKAASADDGSAAATSIAAGTSGVIKRKAGGSKKTVVTPNTAWGVGASPSAFLPSVTATKTPRDRPVSKTIQPVIAAPQEPPSQPGGTRAKCASDRPSTKKQLKSSPASRASLTSTTSSNSPPDNFAKVAPHKDPRTRPERSSAPATRPNATTATAPRAKGKVAAFVSSVAGGVAATTWFLYRASTSAGQSPQAANSSSSWKPFSDAHATDRHPSWGWKRDVQSDTPSGKGDADKAPGGRGGGAATESKAGPTVPEATAKDSEDRKAGRVGGREKGDVEREWPVFGSDGVGGRFGAF